MPSDKYWLDKIADSHLARLDVKKQNKKELQGFLHLFDSPPTPPLSNSQERERERGLGNVCLFSLCEQLSVKGGRDISNSTSVRLCIGCPEIFFQINTAWFNLGGQTYQATNSINRWGGIRRKASHWLWAGVGEWVGGVGEVGCTFGTFGAMKF